MNDAPAPLPPEDTEARPIWRRWGLWRRVILYGGAAWLIWFIMLSPHRFLKASTRSKASRVKADLRSMATAIETYFIDNQAYPSMIPLSAFARFREVRDPLIALGLTAVNPGRPESRLHGLTTPVSYLTSLFTDPYQPLDKSLPFAYATVGEGWIAYSPGPDGIYDINPPHVFYTGAGEPHTPALINATYDPSNGSGSKGDIWRVMQKQ